MYGTTYPIKERDSLEEIEERASQVNWDEIFSPARKGELIKNFKPKDLVPLPRVEEARVFSVDMTYTLEFDIPDGQGGILYPKGFTFNPLDYLNYKKTLVFINGADREQVDWFKKSEYYKNLNVKLLITDGFYYYLREEMGIPVFYSRELIVNRLQLKAVPSVVRQTGQYMEVTEIDVDQEKDS